MLIENDGEEQQNQTIDLDDDAIDDEQISDAEDKSGEPEQSDDQESDQIDDEIVVSIGDEAPKEPELPAPKWVRELRKSQRELIRENRELKARIETASSTEIKPVPTLGQKPTLENCDYDSEAYETKLAEWYEQKRAHDDAEAQAKAKLEAQERAYRDKLQAYAAAKASLKVRDFEDAEDQVREKFSILQQNVLLDGSDNPAVLVYALGKNPEHAAKLAAIDNPVKLAFALGKLEKDLKVSTRTKQAPPPDKSVSGTGRITGSVNSKLEELRAIAEKSNDYSAVLAYKRQMKLKQSKGK